MEQIKKRDASPPSESSTIAREKFFQEITVHKNDRYALAFFTLNTLNFIQNGDGWYCYCDQMVKKNGVKSKPRWKSGYCQICKIPDLFHDFERFVDKHRFNMLVLCNFYDQLFKDLVKLFDQCPKPAECFLGENMCTVVEIGTLANIGVFPFQKVFGTMTA